MLSILWLFEGDDTSVGTVDRRCPRKRTAPSLISLLQPALQVEPFGEAVDPVIGRQVLLVHAEAVAALCEHVQFDRFVSRGPFFVQEDAIWCEAELIVGCGHDKHRRCISRYGSVFESCSGWVDRSYEGGPAFRSVLEADSGCDFPAR